MLAQRANVPTAIVWIVYFGLLTAMDKRRREPHIPHILGVLNLTPDSFSDGGKFCTEKGEIDVLSAINASIEMFEHGAYAIDIGGDSTRLGSKRVGLEVEEARIMDVVRELKQRGFA